MERCTSIEGRDAEMTDHQAKKTVSESAMRKVLYEHKLWLNDDSMGSKANFF